MFVVELCKDIKNYVLISTYLDNQPTLADSLPTVLFALGCFTTLVA